jgi:hypothetical protein
MEGMAVGPTIAGERQKCRRAPPVQMIKLTQRARDHALRLGA